MRHFWVSRRTTLDGGFNTPPGSHMRDAIHSRKTLPAPSLPADWELPTPGAPFFILDHDRVVRWALTALAVIVITATVGLMFIGHLLFGFFDLG